MKQLTLVVTILILFSGTVLSQSKTVRKANELYSLNKFSEAIPLYQKAIKKEDSRTIKTRLANCYRRTNQMVKAEQIYLEIINSGRFNDRVLLHYSETLMTNEKYNDAKDYLKRYITRKPDDEKGHLLLASCEAVNTIQPYFPKFRRKRFAQNSENDDSSPVYYRNGIAFTSDRNQGNKFLKKKSGWTGRDYAMIYYSSQNIDGTFEIPVSLSSKFNDLNINSGPVSFNAEGNYAVFSRNSKVANNKDEYPMQLYSATTDKDGKWKNVQLINFCRNNSNYMHPALSADGQYLFFAAKRGKGFGGTDLYVSKRKPDGEWEKPENLGPLVNTALNEGFPFVHADGRLFFSSKGHPGYGGFDLFVTQKDASGNWTTPVNLGRPVNSSMDDVSFFLFPDSTGGFFSSAVDKGHDDIYLFSLEEEEEIYVRFEDNAEKNAIASNLPEEESTKSIDPNGSSTPSEKTEAIFQPVSEVSNNEPFDSGQPLENTAEVLKSDEQPETVASELVQPDPTEQEVAENIISDTQFAVSDITQAEENPTTSELVQESIPNNNNEPSTTSTPESTELSTNNLTEEEEEAKPKVVASNSNPPVSDTSPSSIASSNNETSTETEENELQQTGWNKPVNDEVDPVVNANQETLTEAPDNNSNNPWDNTESTNTKIANVNPVKSEQDNSTSNINNTTTKNTETHAFEIHQGEEPDLKPETIKEVRPFKEEVATPKSIDAFGAIEQEIANNTLSKGRTFVLPGVKYPFNEFVYQVSESIRFELDRLAFLLKENDNLSIEIGCYTESFGEDRVNKALSRYRAQAAADYLVNQGVKRSRISARGYGESKPLNQCVNGVLCTRNDHMVNQRMEIKVLGL